MFLKREERMKKINLLLGSLIILVGCEQKVETPTEVVKAVKTIVITEASHSNTRNIAGVVKNSNQSSLSFRVGGRVETVTVNVGDIVSPGQVLATLEQKDYQLTVNSAMAELASARADFLEKADALKRQKNLREKDFVAQVTVDQAQNAFSSAKSNLTIAQSELSAAQNDFGNTVLAAPFDGVISERNVEPFTEISAGSAVFELLREGGLEVDVLLPETLIRDVAYGDAVTVRFPTLENSKIPATITEIGARAETGNAFQVTATLADRPEEIRVGMTAQVAFNFGEQEDTSVYLIPVAAVDVRVSAQQQEDASPSKKVPVFVFDAETSTAKKRIVTIRDIRGNEFEVVSGLAEGDVLITAGVPFLTDGQKVKMWNPNFNVPASIDHQQ